MFPTGKSDLKVVQIKARANSSFALCSNGKVYSWGQNADTKTTKALLGREKQQRHDLPGVVKIPEQFHIKRIKIKDDTLYAFLHNKPAPSAEEEQKSEVSPPA